MFVPYGDAPSTSKVLPAKAAQRINARPQVSVPILETGGVSFAYAEREVIRNVSLTIQPGEFIGLLGPNGSGKSTLLKLLYGYLHPRAGTVQLNGHDLRTLAQRAIARAVAVVPQEAPETFGFTVAERVLMGRHPFLGPFEFETEHDIEIAREAMARTDTLQFRDRTFNEMSGGERQRAMIASALAQTPEVLLLDEPTAMLDIKYQAQIMRLLRQLNQERGTTVVVAIHDLNLAALGCKRLVLLKAGEIMHDGPPAAVLDEKLLASVYDVKVRRADAFLPSLTE
ncbi:MAG: ABC transporter ATP-binding protein [Verrucomicrobia bacterium]|nr:ABC transporter ATP-binding protein [Verrucomicrobiota bacterium]